MPAASTSAQRRTAIDSGERSIWSADRQVGLDPIAHPLRRRRIELERHVLVDQVGLGRADRVDLTAAAVDESTDRGVVRAGAHELARGLDVERVDGAAGGARAPVQRAVDHGIEAEIGADPEQQVVDRAGAPEIERLVGEPRPRTRGRHRVRLEADREHVLDARIGEQLLDELDAERRGRAGHEHPHRALRAARPWAIKLATASRVSSAAAATRRGSSASLGA